MDSANVPGEDPLIAALPPATDYITYLTLLEYQLKPDNLSTLNQILSDDDGTLAAEIGWDLLRLVLPMLQIVPDEANKCLNIIASRGNPREVVVRVAEELERLGQDENENDDEEEMDEDGLPTFAGEAPRIHLGEMKLDGMPPTKETAVQPRPADIEHSVRHGSIPESGSDDTTILSSLLSMLTILHPRIKTQHPSRFLATSLPAALGAYRRLRITNESTSDVIEFLTKMAGRQRPALPPRTSTTGSLASLIAQSAPPSATTVQAPPLPDPEAKSDVRSEDTHTQSNERAIILRLLQAIMLEVLDEFAASFQATDQPSMSWTIRLREKHEPSRVLPNRPTETQRWTQSAELKSRDEIIVKFLKLSKDLNLDIAKEARILTDPMASEGSQQIEQPESDYPTSPSQIPFPIPGVILLFAAQHFAQDMTGLTSTPPISLSAIRNIFSETFAPALDVPHPPSLSQTDALLSLIYMTLQSPLSMPPSYSSSTLSTSASSVADLPFLTNLTNLFTTSPDPHVRDSTHHLTTLILHNHTDPEVKLLYIKSLLSPHQSPASPIHDIQQGNIRALATNWLKDEFASYHINAPQAHEVPSSSSATAAASASLPGALPPTPTVPTQPPALPAAPSAMSVGLDPELMHTDPELAALVFPELPSPPGPFLTGGQPQAPSATGTGTTTTMSSDADLEALLLQIPAYIASLNLICILASLPSSSDVESSVLAAPPPSTRTDTTSTTANTAGSSPENLLLPRATHFLATVSGWVDMLTGFSASIARNQQQRGGSGPVNVSDVYALEDAVGRTKAAVESL